MLLLNFFVGCDLIKYCGNFIRRCLGSQGHYNSYNQACQEAGDDLLQTKVLQECQPKDVYGSAGQNAGNSACEV